MSRGHYFLPVQPARSSTFQQSLCGIARLPHHRAKFAQLGGVGLGMPPKKSLYAFGGGPMLGFGPQDPARRGLRLELRNVTA